MNEDIDNMTNNIDNDNGIIRRNANGEEYTFWTHANFIKPYIINFLKGRFPGKLIVRELNQIDLTVPEENLPIEVQATTVMRTQNNQPMYSHFEQSIEKQINQNIGNCGKCWFFFDSELLRAMINAGRGMSINMVWFRMFMKEEKLKVFTVRYDGIIEEKQYNDFDFLANMSQTCSMAAETDDMILNRNKMKIYVNVVRGYDFEQNEIDKLYDNWREYCELNNIDDTDKNDNFTTFNKKQKDKRTKLYGYILNAMSNLPAINDILGLENYEYHAKPPAIKLGIYDIDGLYGSSNTITRFVDRFNICQYFPGYLRNKEMWDKLKGHSLNPRQFERIIKNGIGDYFWYEKEDKGDIMTESEQVDDKGVNVTIESKDQVITVNIKDKTKQDTIEDAWEN